jgi:hypothetical protein
MPAKDMRSSFVYLFVCKHEHIAYNAYPCYNTDVMSEKRRINEVAIPQGAPYKRANYPGQHDPEIVMTKIVSGAVSRAVTTGNAELERMASGGRPDNWTPRMENQLGEHLPQMTARAALHLEVGDRNTRGDGSVTLGVDDAKRAAQRAVAAGKAAGGTAGDVIVESNLSAGDGSVAEIDGLLGRLRAASNPTHATEAPGERTQVIVPAATLGADPTRPIKLRPDFLGDPAFRGGEATQALNGGAFGAGHGEQTVALPSRAEVTHRISTTAVNSALGAGDSNRTSHNVGERGGVIGGGYPTAPGEQTYNFEALNVNAPGERTAIIASANGPSEMTQPIIGGGDVVGINTLLGFDPGARQIHKI